MKIGIPKNRKELKQHLNDPLFKNAYFLMLSSVTSAGSGFFFWLIAARFYSTENIGLASAIIAAMGLISINLFLKRKALTTNCIEESIIKETGFLVKVFACKKVLAQVLSLERKCFDISLVRFLPEREDKQEMINSCLTYLFKERAGKNIFKCEDKFNFCDSG